MCLLTAIKLFELGRLSSGRAAELAGISRMEFLMILEKHKIFPLESELRDLEIQHAWYDQQLLTGEASSTQ
ncbi:MAG: UPF0175 family protein [Magnetococcus sp. DMHC-1]